MFHLYRETPHNINYRMRHTHIFHEGSNKNEPVTVHNANNTPFSSHFDRLEDNSHRTKKSRTEDERIRSYKSL